MAGQQFRERKGTMVPPAGRICASSTPKVCIHEDAAARDGSLLRSALTFSRKAGSSRSSPSSTSTKGVRAFRIPVFLAEDTPPFGCRRTLTGTGRDESVSSLSRTAREAASVEPSSTRMIFAGGVVWAQRDCTASRIMEPWLKLVTTACTSAAVPRAGRAGADLSVERSDFMGQSSFLR